MDKLNEREHEASLSLPIIGVDRFKRFIRESAAEDHCIAVSSMNWHLDRGDSVEDIFFTGDEDGFHLNVESENERKFTIAFGCVAGPCAGDGGVWSVEFDEDGEIKRLTL